MTKREKKIASIVPQNDYLLVELLPIEYDSPIQLPDSVMDTGLIKYHVLAVGPGKVGLGGVFVPVKLQPGDIVMLSDRGNYIELEPAHPTLKQGFVGHEGGLLLITADGVAAKILPQDEETN